MLGGELFKLLSVFTASLNPTRSRNHSLRDYYEALRKMELFLPIFSSVLILAFVHTLFRFSFTRTKNYVQNFVVNIQTFLKFKWKGYGELF